jgi:hypothetical protein
LFIQIKFSHFFRLFNYFSIPFLFVSLSSFYALGVILCTVLIQTSAADLFTIATAKASDDKPIANDKLKAELLALFKKSDELSLEQTFAMWNYDSDLSKKNAEAQVNIE